MEKRIIEQFNIWRASAVDDPDLVRELADMEAGLYGNSKSSNCDSSVFEAFYRDLEFGTGGLRGILGAGTNRMNIYVISRASQGLANYILKHFGGGNRSVAISYDSRIKSELFARTSAGVFAANGIKVHIYPQLMPVPCLSFATRELHTSAGVMVTASHNPAKYNGYKVYGHDGCQITTEAADEILGEINRLDIFSDVKKMRFEDGLASGMINYIDSTIYDVYVQNVLCQAAFGDDAPAGSGNSEDVGRQNAIYDCKIVYTPLNGAGLKPVTRVLREAGFTDVNVVEEQRLPDGHFPTCPKPNPEMKQSLDLGISLAKETGAGLVVATDPDSDRMGVAVRDRNGEFVLITGNEMGILLLDYICSSRIKAGSMPENPVLVKTIVTTSLADVIAKSYGVQTVNVLTGFKYIGEQIRNLENKGEQSRYIFGFEESYGYLAGTYVRDKDGVLATLLASKMYAEYLNSGITLPEKLEELYQKHGYCLNTLYSFEFEGSEGFYKMQDIMKILRDDSPKDLGKIEITEVTDYLGGINGLPKSDVLCFTLKGGSTVIIRPSGTEPKLKAYLSIKAETRADALRIEQAVSEELKVKIQ